MRERRNARRSSPSAMRALPLLLAAALLLAAGAGAQETRAPAPYFPAPEPSESERDKKLIEAVHKRILSGKPVPRGNMPPQPALRDQLAPSPASREMCEAFWDSLWCTNFETRMMRLVPDCGQCR